MFDLLKNKRFYVSQVDERDCGVAALSMILKHFKSYVSIAHLRDLAKTSMEGTSLLGITTAAESFGLNTTAVQADMSLFDMSGIPYPFIAHVNVRENLQHFYTVFGSIGDQIIVGDPNPSIGMTKIKKRKFEKEWDGYSVFFEQGKDYKIVKEKRHTLWELVPVLNKQHALVSQIILYSLLITLVSILGSYYLQDLIDTLVPGKQFTSLEIVSMGLIVAYVVQQLLSFLQNYLMALMSKRLSTDIILRYIRHLFELPMNFFATRRIGEIVSRFTDANQIIDALANTITTVILDVGIIAVMGSVLIFQNFKLFLISIIAIPLYALIIFGFVKYFNHLNNERMQANSMLSSSIIEDLDGIETIKSLNSEGVSFYKIRHEFSNLLNQTFSYQVTTFVQNSLKACLKLVLSVCVLWYGSILVMEENMSMGGLITFNALLIYFTTPMESIINLQTKLQTARVANNRLNEVYLVESEFKNQNAFQNTDKKLKLNEIHLDHVSFRYGLMNYALNDINLLIPAGSKVALIGVSGSGKSTLAKLLTRFYEPEKGRIRLGKENLNSVGKKLLRATINYLPQAPYIFTGSIEDNLVLGCTAGSVTEETMNWALKIADIYDDIEKMPLKMKTEITSDGGGLSGGQRQRIAIARAVLADAPIMILDESTSNLDVITEKKVISNLLSLKDKTIIFVAHRLTIAEKVDQIVVMKDGKIVEHGTHDSLRNKDGYYAELLNA
ncbi:MAG: peptide cleavage/export ABC transporter [Furfurilactobacillus sp.]|jgi:ABC-type bacteriocin transporter|uniref:peptide cleavage/export ABC transporter n=1 Tax=Furfurilactobacillus TaxID=2767882 RepID=UPI001EEDA2B3|nr:MULTISPECIES: peptide cleavage/export ABC transporter [Furfurilactobacillus]MCF6418771.1 peptide cleavage/export ABC transporter [Furfurilactobacillus milii]MCH4011417.1 peptide cleavage/export ABC transporter [Furfurilactobacillus sp.]MCH4037309.1 peptide cleavage/export ABC transporter [Furfurilactobacillus sp.]MCH4116053.1 peptide cleavage/export ABC transporter [Furfurilactobacillus sp.]MCH4133396.1 peptide cleavage/export ABC transporter [Furfurilactobacillus sp.]